MREKSTGAPISVAHITEYGMEHWLKQTIPTNFLGMSIHLNRYLAVASSRRKRVFADVLPDTEHITKDEYFALVLERQENEHGRVTSAFDINLDKCEFGTLCDDGLWEFYFTWGIVEKVSAILTGRLEQSDGQDPVNAQMLRREVILTELHGSRRLRMEDIRLDEYLDEEKGILRFNMPVYFDPDEVFGTHIGDDTNRFVCSGEPMYNLMTKEVDERLVVYYCRGETVEIPMVYRMDAQERAMMLQKMKAYFLEHTWLHLEDFVDRPRSGTEPHRKLRKKYNYYVEREYRDDSVIARRVLTAAEAEQAGYDMDYEPHYPYLLGFETKEDAIKYMLA